MGYTVGGVVYNFDSAVNQRIKQKFVSRDVYCCVTSMVEYILVTDTRDAPFTRDDVTNYYTEICPECETSYGFELIDAFKCGCCGELYELKPEKCSRCDRECVDLFEELEAYKCLDCGHVVEDVDCLDVEQKEVLEWWMVDDRLAQQLADKGESVLLDEGIWGRTTSGQAILLDHVISLICYDMEILDGQKYSWRE